MRRRQQNTEHERFPRDFRGYLRCGAPKQFSSTRWKVDSRRRNGGSDDHRSGHRDRRTTGLRCAHPRHQVRGVPPHQRDQEPIPPHQRGVELGEPRRRRTRQPCARRSGVRRRQPGSHARHHAARLGSRQRSGRRKRPMGRHLLCVPLERQRPEQPEQLDHGRAGDLQRGHVHLQRCHQGRLPVDVDHGLPAFGTRCEPVEADGRDDGRSR